MKTQLVIMAAGIGSRFGEGIKQFTPLGPHDELIIDYSINEAKKAGFDEVVFIIRKEIEKNFEETIGNRIKDKIKYRLAYQEMDNLPGGFKAPKDRVKPYGTGHCILSAKDIIDSPFLVINADDYYGHEGFSKIHEYLVNNPYDGKIFNMCMAGFKIENTLSDNGAVTRGICKKDSDDFLLSVTETFEIAKNENGEIVGEDSNKNKVLIDNDSVVSMNMFGLPKEFVGILNDKFIKFLEKNNDNIKSEFLLPTIVDEVIKEKSGKVKVLDVKDKWFGVTYKEDKDPVKKALLHVD